MVDENLHKKQTLEYTVFRQSYRETSRDRGFLTENERKFIVGEQELEAQQARNTRYRIRQHAIEGILDIALLSDHRNLDDLRQIANHERIPVHHVAAELVGMAYSLFLLNDDIPDDIGALEASVETALRRYHPYEEAENKRDIILLRSVSADLNVTDFDLEAVERRIRNGEATQNEMRDYYDLATSEEDYDCDEELVEIIESMLSDLKTLSEMAEEE